MSIQDSPPYDRNYKRYCVDHRVSIREAMIAIDNGYDRLCFVTDEAGHLLKVVSGGDIRRALLRGAQLDDPVIGVHDRQAVIGRTSDTQERLRARFSRRTSVIPVVDDEGKIRGVGRQEDLLPVLGVKSLEVTVVGLGYVGLTLGLVLADSGFAVLGFDSNRDLLELLNDKKPPFHEKGLQNFLDAYIGHNLRITDTLRGSSDVYIVTVGTPIDKDSKKPRLDHILAAAENVARVLKKNDLVILRSTVPIGCTRETVLPALEQLSGLTAGRDFFLAFCPERTAEGRALEELRKLPQIVGGFCPRSTELAMRLFNENTHTVIDVGSLEAAELSKLMDNTFRDLIFSYSNQMASLAEQLSVDLPSLIDKVNLGYDRNFIPKPSPGVGGPCLSKDPYILMSNFERFGLDPAVTRSARHVNEAAIPQLCQRAEETLSDIGKSLEKARVFIVGFAFKGHPETSDIRESTTVWFLEELKRRGLTDIRAYDPVVADADLAALGGVTVTDVESGFANADAVFVMNNHESYGSWRIHHLIDMMDHPAALFDCWQVFTSEDIAQVPDLTYSCIGVG